MNTTLTAVPGLKVGHAQADEALTGSTVIVCEGGATGGVDQRGGAPGTRETDLLRPVHLVEKVHAILLTGGSAYGLDAAGGVMKYLEERGVGFNVGATVVPIVPAAVIFDLTLGRADVRPDAAMGYAACLSASTEPVVEGNVGAGTGATVGKILGLDHCMKAGVGSAAMEIGAGVVVGALAVVNVFGDVVDPATNQIIAGARVDKAALAPFADTLRVMRAMVARTTPGFAASSNTCIGVVATNAQLSKEQANKLAQMAQTGVARTVRPAHTLYDGDTIFALATGERPADINIVGAFAAEVMTQAVLRAVQTAKSAGGVPGLGGA